MERVTRVILVVLSLILVFTYAKSGRALADPDSSADGISKKAGKMMINIMDFGAMGDGQTDDSAAIQKAVSENAGLLYFPRGDYLLTKPIEIVLSATGRMGIRGDGSAKLIMAGAGPAIRLVGTHHGTAGPGTVNEGVWKNERMPVVEGLEIVGAHPEADGIEIEYTFKPILSRLIIHDCRHGVHLITRNRDVIISACHIYHNRGAGIYFDDVDLHQVNIGDSHISYNAGGGIKLLNSSIRNLQICGNDIEYNYDAEADESADIWIDVQQKSVREGAIVGNTIQASHTRGGANIRMIGQTKEIANKVGLFSITGNLLGTQEQNIHLKYARGVVISGNCIYGGLKHSILAEDSSNILVGPNMFEHNKDYDYGRESNVMDGILFENCSGCTFSGAHFVDTLADAVVQLRDCGQISMTGCQILNPKKVGILLENVVDSAVSNCIILDRKEPRTMEEAIRVVGGGNNRIDGNVTDAEE